MNRKLHNTAAALFASAGLLVLGLIAATPMPAADASPEAFAAADASRLGKARTEAVAGIAAFAAEAATVAVMAQTLDALEASEGPVREAKPRRKPRRSHQSVAMPFFSFAPRG